MEEKKNLITGIGVGAGVIGVTILLAQKIYEWRKKGVKETLFDVDWFEDLFEDLFE